MTAAAPSYHGSMQRSGRLSFCVASVVLVPALIAGLTALGGCTAEEPPPERRPTRTGPPATAPSSRWVEFGEARVTTAGESELAAAMTEARATADDARLNWTVAEDRGTDRWAIKWAAPTAEGGVEHVWVTPLSWSPFRIEGLLANTPVAELECGRTTGEAVSFPIEAMSDWVHFLTDTDSGPREGGFTVDALESE